MEAPLKNAGSRDWTAERMRLVLINPNTNKRVTSMMVGIARSSSPDAEIDGLTAAYGTQLITNAVELATAASAVADLVPWIRQQRLDGVIVAAFGDPGSSALQRELNVPVTGIAEASMREAAAFGRFAVATTTPGLVESIRRLADRYGYASAFIGTFVTEGNPISAMANSQRLVQELAKACQSAADAGARAVVIGGGPLSLAARALRQSLALPIIEPIPAAVRLARMRVPESP